MASKKRKKSRRWKRNISECLIQKLCEKEGKSLNDPYWKKQIASLLSGCEFIHRKHKNFNETGMNHFKNNLCNKILFYNLYTVLEFKYKKTNKSIMDVRCIRNDKNHKLRITDIIFKTRWYASKFKEVNHKILFDNPFFNFVFNGDIRTVRPASTSEYCYIEWKDNGKWAWIAMSYINAFGNKKEIKFFKENALKFYPHIDFDKIHITDVIKTQNYLGQNNDYDDSNDSNDMDDNKKNNNIKSNGNNDNDYDDSDDSNDMNDNKKNKNIKSSGNNNIKSNENNDNDYDDSEIESENENENETESENENDMDDNKKNKKIKSSRNNNIKSNGNNNNNIKSSEKNDNENSDDMDDSDSIITCPYCKEFTFNKDNKIKEFRIHIANNHKKTNFMKIQSYLFKNNLI